MKTLYEILEIDANSSEEEIKKAFRIKVKLYHPDKNKDPSAKEKFQELKEAYELLSNMRRKEIYDDSLQKPQEKHSLNHGQTLKTSFRVTIQDMINGKNINFSTKRKIHCPSCNGTGSSLKKIKKCEFCNGTGLQGLFLILGQKKKCKYCNGRSFKPCGDPCPKCNGAMLVVESVSHKITLNPLFKLITLPKMGNYPIGEGLPGDLVVEFEIEPHPVYKVEGLDISGVLEISPAQAILGDELELNVLNKILKIKIPHGTQHGCSIEIPEGGIKHENQIGTFKAQIKIIMPLMITEEETDLYNKILLLEKGNTSWPKVLNF